MRAETHRRAAHTRNDGFRFGTKLRDDLGASKVFVLHQANLPSGRRVSHIELGDFLARGHGPEQQALLQMIGSLIAPASAEAAKDSSPGELLTGEGDPGLALTGGSGHA
jgi:hypothetical protein